MAFLGSPIWSAENLVLVVTLDLKHPDSQGLVLTHVDLLGARHENSV